jgi:hypothetical protein
MKYIITARLIFSRVIFHARRKDAMVNAIGASLGVKENFRLQL